MRMYSDVLAGRWAVDSEGGGGDDLTYDAKYLKYRTVRYIIVRYIIVQAGADLYGPAPLYTSTLYTIHYTLYTIHYTLIHLYTYTLYTYIHLHLYTYISVSVYKCIVYKCISV